jgi:hypothetical protein
MLSELLQRDEPRRQYFAMMCGLDVHYDFDKGHPLLGQTPPTVPCGSSPCCRCPARAPQLGEPGGSNITPWADRVQLIDAQYDGTWELPALGVVTAPTAVLIRPDGYVAWVVDPIQRGLTDAMTSWFGPPAAAYALAPKNRSLRRGTAALTPRRCIPLPVVSARLGHSSVRVTAEIYSHMIHGQGDEAATRWDGLPI